MLIAERLLMLDRQLDGSPFFEPRPAVELNRWLSAACLVELAALGRLSWAGIHIAAPEDVSAHYMLLNDAQSVVRKRSMTPRDAVEAVHRSMPRIAQDLLESMVRRGLLIEERKRRMMFFSDVSHPVQSTSTYFENVRHLKAGAESFGLEDLWQLGLILLCDGRQLLKAHAPDNELSLNARLNRFEAMVSSSRATSDLSAQRARLIFALTKFQ
jgi:Golgi phosphoprotein 3 (GPP34)